jgi:hypothetical protein
VFKFAHGRHGLTVETVESQKIAVDNACPRSAGIKSGIHFVFRRRHAAQWGQLIGRPAADGHIRKNVTVLPVVEVLRTRTGKNVVLPD